MKFKTLPANKHLLLEKPFPIKSRKSSRPIRVRALDTEWYSKPSPREVYSEKSGLTFRTGETYLVCLDSINSHSDTPHYLFPKNGNTIEILDFLLKNCRSDRNIVFVYNLSAEFDAIFRQWIIEQWNKLKGGKKLTPKRKEKFIQSLTKKHIYTTPAGKKVCWEGFVIKDSKTGKHYNVQWRKDAFFAVSDGKKRRFEVVDLTNFYPRLSLKSNAKKYCQRTNVDEFIKSKSEFDHNAPWKYTKEELVTYATADCNFEQELGEILVDAIVACFGELPKKLRKISTIAKQQMLKLIKPEYLKPLAFIKDKSELELAMQAQEYAIRSLKGGLFFTTVKGFFTNVYALDLNSAYANGVANLPDMVHGHWKFIIGKPSPDATFGVYRTIHKFDGLFQWKMQDGEILMPKTEGMYEDYITKAELDFMINNYGWKSGIDYIVIDGYEFIHDKDVPVVYPFRAIVDKMFELKAAVKADPLKGDSSMEYRLYKTIPNSMFGILAENKFGCGILSNYVYGSLIPAITRMELRKFCLEHNLDPLKDVLEFATDCLFLRILPPSFKPSKDLGKFSIDEHKSNQPMVIVSSGFSLDKNGNPIRYRGIPMIDTSKSSSSKKFTLEPLEALFEKERPLKIVEALIRGEPEMINVFDKKFGTKKICYTDDRRHWFNSKRLVSMNDNWKISKEELLNPDDPFVSEPFTEYDLQERGEPLVGFKDIKQIGVDLSEEGELLDIFVWKEWEDGTYDVESVLDPVTPIILNRKSAS